LEIEKPSCPKWESGKVTIKLTPIQNNLFYYVKYLPKNLHISEKFTNFAVIKNK
jgi:hypothetical protein